MTIRKNRLLHTTSRVKNLSKLHFVTIRKFTPLKKILFSLIILCAIALLYIIFGNRVTNIKNYVFYSSELPKTNSSIIIEFLDDNEQDEIQFTDFDSLFIQNHKEWNPFTLKITNARAFLYDNSKARITISNDIDSVTGTNILKYQVHSIQTEDQIVEFTNFTDLNSYLQENGISTYNSINEPEDIVVTPADNISDTAWLNELSLISTSFNIREFGNLDGCQVSFQFSAPFGINSTSGYIKWIPINQRCNKRKGLISNIQIDPLNSTLIIYGNRVNYSFSSGLFINGKNTENTILIIQQANTISYSPENGNVDFFIPSQTTTYHPISSVQSKKIHITLRDLPSKLIVGREEMNISELMQLEIFDTKLTESKISFTPSSQIDATYGVLFRGISNSILLNGEPIVEKKELLNPEIWIPTLSIVSTLSLTFLTYLPKSLLVQHKEK